MNYVISQIQKSFRLISDEMDWDDMCGPLGNIVDNILQLVVTIVFIFSIFLRLLYFYAEYLHTGIKQNKTKQNLSRFPGVGH